MSPTLHNALSQRADTNGVLSFRDFSEVALYHPELGYYRRDRQRVGRTREADFYTAASLGGVFANLLHAAMGTLCDRSLGDYTLVELGAEPGKGTMEQHATSFANYQAIGAADEYNIPAKAIVFANELLDAQPFHRFIFTKNTWHERGVQITDGSLTEVTLPQISAAAEAFVATLPAVSEGNQLDISLDAESLLARIAAQVNDGLLIFFDYGKSWQELIEACPAGTARAYFHHETSKDLLANPSEQDLTCHVCWDRLEAVLHNTGWANAALERQEAYFMKHATAAIERIIMADDPGISRDKQTLKELIYPGHMGHKFQVLFAQR